MEQSPSVVMRISALLRALTTCEPTGASTTSLANVCDIPRPTAHRLLTSLQAEHLTDRDDATGLWHLGAECFLLGAAAMARHDVTQAARPLLRALSRETGESSFLSVRRGDETVCVLREDGSFPIRSHVLHEGIRFPLGVASAGLAILSFLSDHDRDDFLSRTDLVAEHGPDHEAEAVRERVACTRAQGFAVNPGLLVPGSWGLGAAVFDHAGDPRWAISITGIEARLAPPRQSEIGAMLLRAAHVLTGEISARTPAASQRPSQT